MVFVFCFEDLISEAEIESMFFGLKLIHSIGVTALTFDYWMSRQFLNDVLLLLGGVDFLNILGLVAQIL